MIPSGNTKKRHHNRSTNGGMSRSSVAAIGMYHNESKNEALAQV
jgi:hypothetical protein